MPASNRNYAENNSGRPPSGPNGSYNGGEGSIERSGASRNGSRRNYSNSSGDGGRGHHNASYSGSYNGSYNNNAREGYGRSYNSYSNGRGDRGQRDDFTYDIVDSYGAIAVSPTGWTKELNRVSWNGKEPKFDIREWSPDHGRMRRGVTFTEEEALELRDLLETAIAGLPISVFTDREIDCAIDEAISSMPQLDSGPLIDDADIVDDNDDGGTASDAVSDSADSSDGTDEARASNAAA